MKKLLLTTALLLSASPAALAQMAPCVDNGVSLVCDPTAYHVSSPTATGQDPVLLNDSNTFTITEVGNHNISAPTRVLIIEPGTSQTASITGVTGQMASLVTGADPTGAFSFGATSISALGAFNPLDNAFDGPAVTLSSGQDLVKQIGFNGGAASISFTNIATEYAALGLTVPTVFDVFDAVVPVNFTSDSDFLTVNGSFTKGTVISAIGIDIGTNGSGRPQVTVFDNSWTTAGFVNAASIVPEPSTWAMFIVGFGLMGFIGWRKSVGQAKASSPTVA